MPPAAATSATSEAARSPWAEIEDHLERARRSILAEIRNYPPPIAASEQQFNHLLEQRDRIARDLRRLAALRRGRSTGETDPRGAARSHQRVRGHRSRAENLLRAAVEPTARRADLAAPSILYTAGPDRAEDPRP
jgi:hypothetical protein